MADAGNNAESTHFRDRLAQLCIRLGDRSGPLTTDGAMRALADQIIAGVRAGQDPSGVGTEFDQLFDQLEELLLRAGYAAGLGRYRAFYIRLLGVGDGRPVLHVLACPTELCSRVELPATDPGSDPDCDVTGERLRRVRLDS